MSFMTRRHAIQCYARRSCDLATAQVSLLGLLFLFRVPLPVKLIMRSLLELSKAYIPQRNAGFAVMYRVSLYWGI